MRKVDDYLLAALCNIKPSCDKEGLKWSLGRCSDDVYIRILQSPIVRAEMARVRTGIVIEELLAHVCQEEDE